MRKRTFSKAFDSCSITLLNSPHGSAHDAQKLRTDTLFKSADRRSLKWSGEVTSTRFVDAMIAVVYGNLRYSDRHFSQLMCGGVLRRLSTSPFLTTEPKWSEISTRKRVVKERQYYLSHSL